MSEHNPSIDVTESIEPVTATLVLPRFGDEQFPPGEVHGLGDEDWPAQTVKRGVHLRMPTAILLALFLAASGLWGGSLLQKHEGGSTGATGAAAARAAFGRAGGAAPSASASGTSTSTSGTVTDIIGTTLYVTNSSGQLIKVTLSSSATVTRNATSSLSGLKPGDTVTVQGTAPANGSMTASSVAATAKGVTNAGAGGGRFGGLGGGAGGTGGASS